MPDWTQNVSRHVLTKPIECQRGLNMYLNMCWTNLSHNIEDTECLLKCVDPTLPMPARTQNAKCVEQTSPMPVRNQHIPQHVRTKTSLAQRDQKIVSQYLRPNPYHASEDKKCISTYDDQTFPIPERTQNVSQHVLKVSEDLMCTSTCVYQIFPMLARK